MSRRVAILQGHPDPLRNHYGHALAEAYADGARRAGHGVRFIEPALDPPAYIINQADWATPATRPATLAAQETLTWCDHLAVFYPLWLGDVPALLKAFLEEVSRGGFMISVGEDGRWTAKMAGRSARVVVTMGMPAIAYRVYYLSHSLKSLERNVLAFAGFSPVRDTVIGMVEASAEDRAGWLEEMRELGASAS
jgi:putative NADPH-quinone reductase